MRGFIMWFMSAETKKKAEAESRQWIGACPNCGAETSIWDLGGIRYKAAGRPVKLAKCRACKQVGPHAFEKRE